MKCKIEDHPVVNIVGFGWGDQSCQTRVFEEPEMLSDYDHKKGFDEDLKFAWNDEAETARKESVLMTENTHSVSADAGTATRGSSIQGETTAAVVRTLPDARDPADQ